MEGSSLQNLVLFYNGHWKLTMNPYSSINLLTNGSQFVHVFDIIIIGSDKFCIQQF